MGRKFVSQIFLYILLPKYVQNVFFFVCLPRFCSIFSRLSDSNIIHIKLADVHSFHHIYTSWLGILLLQSNYLIHMRGQLMLSQLHTYAKWVKLHNICTSTCFFPFRAANLNIEPMQLLYYTYMSVYNTRGERTEYYTTRPQLESF